MTDQAAYNAVPVRLFNQPRWVIDSRSDVWSRWVSDDLYHQGSRTASLADVVKHYGPVQELTPGRVLRDA